MTASCAPIVGANDPPRLFPSYTFHEDGWYAFRMFGPKISVILHARRFDHQFIALAEGPTAKPLIYASDSAFEFWCIGKAEAVPSGVPTSTGSALAPVTVDHRRG